MTHTAMPARRVCHSFGQTHNGEHTHVIEYSVKLDSNPEFTASILVCYARAAYRMRQTGETGAKSVFDVAPGLLSQKSAQELRATML